MANKISGLNTGSNENTHLQVNINPYMKIHMPIKDYVQKVILANRFAVLATEHENQPHASLIGVTPTDGFKKLIFATYRNTRKYTNLIMNGKVAILFENRSIKSLSEQEITVLTAYGQAEETNAKNNTQMLEHLQRHPELKTFLSSKDCALFLVKVNAYQLVRGIEDVIWCSVDDLDVLR